MNVPRFPNFVPLALEHRDVIHPLLWAYQPTTSELTFTNLFLWQGLYGWSWCLWDDWFVAMAQPRHEAPWFLPPIGPDGRAELCLNLLQWLRQSYGVAYPAIERADRRLVEELRALPRLRCEPSRDHFDYVYRATDLISLAGNKFHSKRNHINSIKRSYPVHYEALHEDLLDACLRLADQWCEFKRCAEDLNLTSEWEAIRLALRHYRELALQGGAIVVRDRVEAFSLGELLNHRTAVIHIEKANPEVSGFYTLINQQFCEHAWQEVELINREQDLGEPGLRRAKQSYQPIHLEEKFRLTLT